MKISIGADHRGYELKQHLITYFSAYSWIDQGATSEQRSDYPVFAKRVCNDLLQGKAEQGVLLCGSGVGISIAANRHKKIYAALCWSADIARLAREDDGANVLVLPADFITPEQAVEIFQQWHNASFKQGIYQKRLDMIDLDL
ncbi:MAG: RpiB/LacA/LacB family sugar-phosphate isomerase [Epsilonproteobacteria bacterium]|nr:RpiB/LacA/LacB family sugar-phosphate isomerase [Campylobacterota bacterium]